MANPTEWGPPLWRILHTQAERLGRHVLPVLITDEQRAWIHFLKSLETAIPCQKCRQHYKAWRTKHPLERFATVRGDALRSLARSWVWGLHSEVNWENGKQEGEPKLEEMETLYGARSSQEIASDIKEVLRLFQQAIILRLLTPEPFHTFKQSLALLRRVST
jgi:Erv1 / Alr family